MTRDTWIAYVEMRDGTAVELGVCYGTTEREAVADAARRYGYSVRAIFVE